MYKGHPVICILPAYNEAGKASTAVSRVPRDIVDKILVVDDGSTDDTAKECRQAGAEVVSLGRCIGVGAALRHGLRYAQSNGYDLAVFIAGNNKDEPLEIPRLLEAICDRGYDLVQGSRFLPGGHYGGDMPIYRRLFTRFHAVLMSVAVRKWITESTNGFRALRLALLSDPRINLDQPWLDKYELEPYLLFKVIRLGYRHTEVPCTKIYPPRSIGYTKMKPVTGWWSILRPVLVLGLGLRN